MLFAETTPFVASLDRLDMPGLRRAFVDLMNRAALAVQRAGLDVDDVVVERKLTCRTARGRQATLEAEWISDAGRLAAAVRRAMQVAPAEEPVEVVAINVEVRRDVLLPGMGV